MAFNVVWGKKKKKIEFNFTRMFDVFFFLYLLIDKLHARSIRGLFRCHDTISVYLRFLNTLEHIRCVFLYLISPFLFLNFLTTSRTTPHAYAPTTSDTRM